MNEPSPTSAPVGRLGAALIFAAALTPLVIWNGTAYPFVVPRGAWIRGVAAGALVVLIILLSTRRLRVSRPLDPMGLAVLVYLAVGLITALVGVSPAHSLYGDLSRMWGLLTWAAFTILYFAQRILPSPRGWTLVLDVTLGAGTLVTALGLLQLALRVPHVSLLGNVAYVGILAFLLAGLSLYLRSATRGHPIRRGIYAAAAALNLAAVIFSGERGPVLALLVFTFVMAVVAVVLSDRVPLWVRWLPLALVLMGGLALALRGNPAVRRVPQIARVVNTSLDDADLGFRLSMWRAAVAEIGANPLAGIGMENFSVAFSRHFPPEVYRLYPGGTYVDRAHNAYLDAAVAGGVPGLLAFLGIWVAVFLTLRRGWRSGRMRAAEIAPLAGAFAGYLAYLFFWFGDLASSVVLFTLLAIAGRRAHPLPPVVIEGPRRVNALQRLSIGLAAALVLVLGYRHAVLPAIAAARVIPAVDASRENGLETRLSAYRSANGYGAVEASELVISMAEYLEGARGAMPEARSAPARVEIVDAAFQDAFAHLDRYRARDPQNDAWYRARSGVLSSAAIFYQDGRYHELALRDVRRAIELSPTRVGHYYHLSNLLLLGGNVAGAEEALRRAERLDPLYGGTAYRFARMRLVLNNVEEARRMIRRSWALGYFPVERRTVQDVVGELGEAGRWEAGGSLVSEYLEARYGGVRQLTPGDTADARVVELGMEMYGRAGRSKRAVELARSWNRLVATSGGSRRSSAPAPR